MWIGLTGLVSATADWAVAQIETEAAQRLSRLLGTALGPDNASRLWRRTEPVPVGVVVPVRGVFRAVIRGPRAGDPEQEVRHSQRRDDE